MTSRRGWKRKFEDPIQLAPGRQLVTLEDAARYIQKLPKAEQQIEEWQTAVETLILVAESNGGPTMLAKTVLIHVNTSKDVGDADHLKVFASEDAAERWFGENDPEGVALSIR